MDSNANGPDGPATPGLSDHLGALLAATRNWLTDSLGLILLDGQLAGVSLVRMIVYGLVAFVMFVTGWLALMLSTAFLLHRLGIAIELVILAVAILTIALGVFLVFRITALSENITFRTTRQHFGKDSFASRLPHTDDASDVATPHVQNVTAETDRTGTARS